jgi:arylsulfatase A-like enzyme
MCGEHGRHNKGIPCEGSARVPFVMAAPGLVPAGTILREAMGTVDFKPTLLGLLGMEAGKTMQGRDCSEIFRKGVAPAGWVDRAFVRIGGEEGGGNSWVAVFTGRHKLIFSPRDAPALFDLERDPFELSNLLDEMEQRDLIRELAGLLQGYLEDSGDPLARSEAIRADVAWAVSDAADYVVTPRSADKREERRKEKGKGKGKGKGREKNR